MKVFLLVALFALAFVVSSLAMAWSIASAQFRSMSLALPADRSILFLGDSHIQTPVNDQIVAGAKNIAYQGEGYFYSFLKVRAMLRANPQIETVVFRRLS